MNQLACWDGSAPPGAAVNCGTSASTGVIGVVIGNAGTTGSADIVQYGPTSCLFDATAAVMRHYIVPSTTSAGRCLDGGTGYPATMVGFPIGIVTASAPANSVTTIFLFNLSTSPGTYSITTAPVNGAGTVGTLRLDTGPAAAARRRARSRSGRPTRTESPLETACLR